FTAGSGLDIQVFSGRAYDVMASSDLILIASGTATLEAAIIGTPMVITYRVAPLTYIIGKMLVDIDFVGLPNIVSGEGVVPELIQGDATGERMADEALRMLGDSGYLTGMKNKLGKVRDTLGGPGASRRAAEIVYRAV
ncbi:MAG TPA: lipid-A-disaccharide synthase, partial [Thermodesulfobacteriota bacterium]|nr:lipid-A-disaccharide synthase [Thermodesulfobacteriota bacterium]